MIYGGFLVAFNVIGALPFVLHSPLTHFARSYLSSPISSIAAKSRARPKHAHPHTHRHTQTPLVLSINTINCENRHTHTHTRRALVLSSSLSQPTISRILQNSGNAQATQVENTHFDIDDAEVLLKSLILSIRCRVATRTHTHLIIRNRIQAGRILSSANKQLRKMISLKIARKTIRMMGARVCVVCAGSNQKRGVIKMNELCVCGFLCKTPQRFCQLSRFVHVAAM